MAELNGAESEDDRIVAITKTVLNSWKKWLLEFLGSATNERPVLSSERAPHINKTATMWQ
jgi:hypothetical protein